MSDPDWYTKAKAEGRILSETKVSDGLRNALKAPGATISNRKGKRPAGKLVSPETKWGATWIEFTLALRLEPVSNNGVFKKWLIGQAGRHRRAVCFAFAAHVYRVCPFVARAQNGQPLGCTITRIGRGMDEDNLAACCKQVRDAVALYLGVDDGPKGPIRWEYRQESRMVFGTKVRLEVPQPSPPADRTTDESSPGRS